LLLFTFSLKKNLQGSNIAYIVWFGVKSTGFQHINGAFFNQYWPTPLREKFLPFLGAGRLATPFLTYPL
jgi:hypothetical protein